MHPWERAAKGTRLICETSERGKGMVATSTKSSTGLDENVAAFLSYLLGFITGFVFYWEEKKSAFVRFHALQSIITFIILWIILLILGWVPVLGTLIKILVAMLWVLLMVRAYCGKLYRVPFIGTIAEDVVKRWAQKKVSAQGEKP
jgi:uncharacterized membrane protein